MRASKSSAHCTWAELPRASVISDNEVASLKEPARISISGFEVADESAHMFEWLGRGHDFRTFVTRDVERELYAQDAGAQLISIACVDKPDLETRLMPRNDGTTLATLTSFRVVFKLSVLVAASNGTRWRLDLRPSYFASNLDQPSERKLQYQFSVAGSAEAR
jgi:hypothetical protein